MDEANRYAAEKNIDLAAMLAGGPGTQEPEEEEGKKNQTKAEYINREAEKMISARRDL